MGQNWGLQNNFLGTYVQHCGSQSHPAEAMTNSCQPQTAQSQLHMVHNSWPPKYNSPIDSVRTSITYFLSHSKMASEGKLSGVLF